MKEESGLMKCASTELSRCNARHTPSSGGVSPQQTIRIPELDAIIESEYHPKFQSWSDRDLEQLKLYYGKVPVRKLAEALHRSIDATMRKANRLSLTMGGNRG